MQTLIPSRLLAYSSVLSDEIINNGSNNADYSTLNNSASAKKSFKFPKFKFSTPKMPKKSIKLLAVFILLLLAFYLGGKLNSTSQNPVLGNSDERVQAPLVKATQKINKEFQFPIKDNKNIEVSKLKYEIVSIDLQDALIIKGQRATAIKGKTFLVLNLKITNEHNQRIEINSRDYIRLIINNTKDMLAADIHNDPVQIQSISTKLTRIAFPIFDTDNNLILKVGEINGDKQEIKLALKRI